LTTTIHTAVDGLGNPLRFILTPGQASDYTQAEPLLAGFPAQHVIADKGYDSPKIVEAVGRSGAQAVIPPRSCLKNPRDTDFAMYAERYRIECCFNKLKHYRAVATRSAKRTRNFASLIYLAASMLWLK
jgi:transposase